MVILGRQILENDINSVYIKYDRKEGGAVTMCAVADALITEGIVRGRQEGRLEGRIIT